MRKRDGLMVMSHLLWNSCYFFPPNLLHQQRQNEIILNHPMYLVTMNINDGVCVGGIRLNEITHIHQNISSVLRETVSVSNGMLYLSLCLL